MSLKPFSLSPCGGLYDLTVQFGGEYESLPQDCNESLLFDQTDASKTEAIQMSAPLNIYRKNLWNLEFVPTALRMAFVIGSIIFAVNHGGALAKDEMTRSRWFSGSLSFITPYLVSIYSQTQCQLKSR